MLFASDMQKLVKRMRSKRYGYKVRYIIAGEYGSTYGRAHWHGIFHFYGDRLPDWQKHTLISDDQYERIGGVHIPEWSYDDGSPIGHVHIKPAQYAHVRYALKYMLKDQDDPQNAIKVLMSKYPPLGSEYLIQLAKDNALAGIPPRDLTYRFPVTKYNGEQELKRFMMRGKIAEVFVETFIAEWQRLYGDMPIPESDLIGGYQRFGKIGRSEYLTPNYVQEEEAQQKWEARLARMERPRTLKEYWQEQAISAKMKREMNLATWEAKYFGPKQQQGSGHRPEYNDERLLFYVLWKTGLTELEFWAKPWPELERLWGEQERAYLAVPPEVRRSADFPYTGWEQQRPYGYARKRGSHS